MKSNKWIILLIGILIVLLTTTISCGKSNDIQPGSESSIAQMYCAALDSLIPIEEALNSDMEYIAIDIDTLEISTERQKEIIKDYFSKYEVPVIFESHESLKEKGMVIDDFYIEGILLSVEKTKITGDNAVIECSKYKSGLAAIGVRCELIFKDGIWEVESAVMIWIS